MDIEQLIGQLGSTDRTERLTAAESLMRQGSPEAAVALIPLADDPDEAVREAAVGALEELGAPLAEQVGGLCDTASASDGDAAYWAITLLGRLALPTVEIVTLLGDVVSSSRPVVLRERAAWALGKMSSGAQAALPNLREATRSDNARLTKLATRAVEQIESTK